MNDAPQNEVEPDASVLRILSVRGRENGHHVVLMYSGEVKYSNGVSIVQNLLWADCKLIWRKEEREFCTEEHH